MFSFNQNRNVRFFTPLSSAAQMCKRISRCLLVRWSFHSSMDFVIAKSEVIRFICCSLLLCPDTSFEMMINRETRQIVCLRLIRNTLVVVVVVIHLAHQTKQSTIIPWKRMHVIYPEPFTFAACLRFSRRLSFSENWKSKGDCGLSNVQTMRSTCLSFLSVNKYPLSDMRYALCHRDYTFFFIIIHTNEICVVLYNATV